MITILDGNFKKVDILRKYEYLQYTEPIRDIGTFELRATLNDDTRRFIKAAELQYYYLMFDETYIAKIEKITQSDEETGIDTVVITGRNSLFILAKRVIKGTIEFNGKTAQYIKTLIEANVTGADLGNRRINAEVILDNEEYLLTQCNTINKQVTGGYVWDEVLDALEQDKLGIYMIPILQNVSEAEDYNVDHWEIHITAGVNRTKGNYLGNPSVTFSQSLSNIARTTYERDITNFGTIYYVAGEGEGEDRKWFEVADKEEEELASGWDRAEIWVDARDVQSTIDGGDTTLADEDYEALIVNRAGEKMKDHQETITYEATITKASRPYTYGKDYNKADFVTVVDNKLGIEVEAQIVGLTTTYQGAQVIRDVNFLYGSVKGDPIRQIQQNNQNTGDNTVNIKYVENKVLEVYNGNYWTSGRVTPYYTTNNSNNMTLHLYKVGPVVIGFLYSLMQFPVTGNTGDLIEITIPKMWRPSSRRYFSSVDTVSGTVTGHTRFVISNGGKLSIDVQNAQYQERMACFAYPIDLS